MTKAYNAPQLENPSDNAKYFLGFTAELCKGEGKSKVDPLPFLTSTTP